MFIHYRCSICSHHCLGMVPKKLWNTSPWDKDLVCPDCAKISIEAIKEEGIKTKKTVWNNGH